MLLKTKHHPTITSQIRCRVQAQHYFSCHICHGYLREVVVTSHSFKPIDEVLDGKDDLAKIYRLGSWGLHLSH